MEFEIIHDGDAWLWRLCEDQRIVVQSEVRWRWQWQARLNVWQTRRAIKHAVIWVAEQ